MQSNYISTRDLPTQQNHYSLDPNLRLFSENFKGTPIIIVESTCKDNNIGKLHPMKIIKLFLTSLKAFDI